MLVMILAGGYGSRIADVADKIPKPMIMLDDKPMIEHIIDIYKKNNFKKFIILGGYKHKTIELFFKKKNKKFSDCEIKVLNTGLKTLTGTRILKAKKFINEKNFMVTYGDGLADINLKKLLKFHLKNRLIATITGVRPPARFGELILKKNKVYRFDEKIQLYNNWINGGFFVFKKEFLNYIPKKENVMLETKPIQNLLKIKNLGCYRHNSFWQCVDNRRDLLTIKKLIKENKAPWLKQKI